MKSLTLTIILALSAMTAAAQVTDYLAFVNIAYTINCTRHKVSKDGPITKVKVHSFCVEPGFGLFLEAEATDMTITFAPTFSWGKGTTDGQTARQRKAGFKARVNWLLDEDMTWGMLGFGIEQTKSVYSNTELVFRENRTRFIPCAGFTTFYVFKTEMDFCNEFRGMFGAGLPTFMVLY